MCYEFSPIGSHCTLSRKTSYIFKIENLNDIVATYVSYMLSTKVQTGPKVWLSNTVLTYICKTLD